MENMDCYLEKLYEAEEIPVVKDGDLSLPLNEIVVRNYDRHLRYGTDWVTEYNYLCEKSLTEDEYTKLLQDAGHELVGEIHFKKRKLTYSNGKIYYRHICECIMY